MEHLAKSRDVFGCLQYPTRKGNKQKSKNRGRQGDWNEGKRREREAKFMTWQVVTACDASSPHRYCFTAQRLHF